MIVWENNISPPGSVYLYETDAANGIYTLQGAIDGFANDQTYNYSIKSINQSKGCESLEIVGSLSVQKGHNLVRTQGSNNQTICEGEAIEPITFKFSEGAVSASPVNIPPGLDWIINDVDNELIISGIPISTDVDELTIKTFVVETIGNSCTTDQQPVTISIEPMLKLVLNPLLKLDLRKFVKDFQLNLSLILLEVEQSMLFIMAYLQV